MSQMRTKQSLRAIKAVVLLSITLLAGNPLLAMEGHEPPVFVAKVDELEARQDGGDSALAWSATLGGGSDLNQVWLETEGERVGGVTGDHELRLYYSRAVAPFWNLNIGWQGDLIPAPERNWLLLGLAGQAPFHIDTEVRLFVGNKGRSGLEIELEKEFMVTRRWVLIPEVTVDLHGHNDPGSGAGSGLSGIQAGVRMAYRATPRLIPYAGVVWEKNYGNTARYARLKGEKTEAAQVVLGVKFWL